MTIRSLSLNDVQSLVIVDDMLQTPYNANSDTVGGGEAGWETWTQPLVRDWVVKLDWELYREKSDTRCQETFFLLSTSVTLDLAMIPFFIITMMYLLFKFRWPTIALTLTV